MKKKINISDITDWYLTEDVAEGLVYPGPHKIGLDPEIMLEAMDLLDLCMERKNADFLIRKEHFFYRGHHIESINGNIIHLRKIPSSIPEFHKLGLNENMQRLMMHPRMGGSGIVLVAGETGQGKSTTCASFIKQRLEKFNSFCLTLENPPEFPLGGSYGKGGFCVQTEVLGGQFGEALRGAVRSYPTQGNSILFIGEIRDQETAAEALRIAVNGHLVVSTIHSANSMMALKRFMTLASGAPGMNMEECKSLCSSALRLVVHQQLKLMAGEKVDLKTEMLFSPNHSSAVANKIRSNMLDGLGTEIQNQAILLEQGNWEKLLQG